MQIGQLIELLRAELGDAATSDSGLIVQWINEFLCFAQSMRPDLFVQAKQKLVIGPARVVAVDCCREIVTARQLGTDGVELTPPQVDPQSAFVFDRPFCSAAAGTYRMNSARAGVSRGTVELTPTVPAGQSVHLNVYCAVAPPQYQLGQPTDDACIACDLITPLKEFFRFRQLGGMLGVEGASAEASASIKLCVSLLDAFEVARGSLRMGGAPDARGRVKPPREAYLRASALQ